MASKTVQELLPKKMQDHVDDFQELNLTEVLLDYDLLKNSLEEEHKLLNPIFSLTKEILKSNALFFNDKPKLETLIDFINEILSLEEDVLALEPNENPTEFFENIKPIKSNSYLIYNKFNEKIRSLHRDIEINKINERLGNIQVTFKLDQINSELERFRQEADEIGNIKKQIIRDGFSTEALEKWSSFFRKQEETHNKAKSHWKARSDNWLSIIILYSTAILVSYSLPLVNYAYKFLSPNYLNLTNNNYFIFTKYTIGLLLLVSFLFARKQYLIEKNLEYINSHRANIAGTLKLFIESNQDREIKSDLIRMAAEYMFKMTATGMIKNKELENEKFIEILINKLQQL